MFVPQDAEEGFLRPVDLPSLLESAQSGEDLRGPGREERRGGIAAVIEQGEERALWKSYEPITFQGFAQIFLRGDADREDGSEVQGDAFLAAGDSVTG